MIKNSLIIIALLLIVTKITHASRFTDNSDGTITDRSGGIVWQQGEGGLRSWYDAVQYCDSLSLAGYDDWRLPTIEELESLADENLGYPRIDTHYFPDFPATHVNYWSSSETGRDALRAKGFVFTICAGSDFLKKEKHRVRCVRSGQPYGDSREKKLQE